MEIKFDSLEELYNRLTPALKCKAREFRKNNHDYITHYDIWNYLKSYKWTQVTNLNLYEMINDILNVDIEEIDNYVKNSFKNTKRNVILKEGEGNE